MVEWVRNLAPKAALLCAFVAAGCEGSTIGLDGTLGSGKGPDGSSPLRDLGDDPDASRLDAMPGADRPLGADGGRPDLGPDAGAPDLGPEVVAIPPALDEIVPRALDWRLGGGVLAFTFESAGGLDGSLVRVNPEGTVEPWSEASAPRFEGAENVWLVRAGSALHVMWTGEGFLARHATVNAAGTLGVVRELALPSDAPSFHRVVDVTAIPESLFLVVSTGPEPTAPRRVLRQATTGEPANLWPLELQANSRRRFLPIRDASRVLALWFEESSEAPGYGSLMHGTFDHEGVPQSVARRLSFYSGAGEETFATAEILGAVTTENALFVAVSVETGSHGTSVWGLRYAGYAESAGRIDPWPGPTGTYQFHHASFLHGDLDEIVFGVHHPTSNPRRFWVDVHRVNAQREPLGSARLERTASVVAFDGGFAVSCVGERENVRGLRCRRQAIP